MARHNVIFGNDKEVKQGNTQWSSSFDEQPRNDYNYPNPNSSQQQQAQPYDRDTLEAMYARPSATGHDTGRMTMRDALNAITISLGIVIVVGGLVAISPYIASLVMGPEGESLAYTAMTGLMIVGVIGGFVTGLINGFSRQPSPVLVVLYALFQGVTLGGFSGFMEYQYPGIVIQAVLGTFVVAAVVLLMTNAGILRTSPMLTRVVAVAMIAYLAFMLLSVVLSLVTGYSPLRTGVIGLIISAIAVVMASYCLVSDIEDVKRAVNNGVERSYMWRCAFGVTATLVWLYIEVLRIISIFRSN